MGDIMKVQFAGVGSAFTDERYWQSNALVISDSGKKLLIDAGGDIRHSLRELGITNENVGEEIDAVYISHCHADHIGGLEWLGFCAFFNEDCKKPTLYTVSPLLSDLWRSLQSGMQSHNNMILEIDDYFDVQRIAKNSSFEWEGIQFTPIQTIHIMNGYTLVHSYGLLIKQKCRTVFFTTDTQFCPSQIKDFYKSAEVIFHDCETADYKSGVHAHYDELITLPKEYKNKMWLYHYQPDPVQSPEEDGFLGFVQKGQIFDFSCE